MISATAPQTESPTPSTAERILDVAQRLAQTRGYNGFSDADIAAEIGVTKASLHYHFPSKAALDLALVTRYTTGFVAALDEIAASRGLHVREAQGVRRPLRSRAGSRPTLPVRDARRRDRDVAAPRW